MITGRELHQLFDLNWVESSDTWRSFETVEEAAAAYDAAAALSTLDCATGISERELLTPV
jgi:hypothetical protein